MKDIREAGRNTMGVKLVNLDADDKLQAIAPVISEDRGRFDQRLRGRQVRVSVARPVSRSYRSAAGVVIRAESVEHGGQLIGAMFCVLERSRERAGLVGGKSCQIIQVCPPGDLAQVYFTLHRPADPRRANVRQIHQRAFLAAALLHPAVEPGFQGR